MNANISKLREPAEKVKTEKEQHKATKQVPRMEAPREEENPQDETTPSFETMLRAWMTQKL